MNPHNGCSLFFSDDDDYAWTKFCCLSPTEATFENDISFTAEKRITSTYAQNKQASGKKLCQCSIGNGDANDCTNTAQLIIDFGAGQSYSQKYKALLGHHRSCHEHEIHFDGTDSVASVSVDGTDSVASVSVDGTDSVASVSVDGTDSVASVSVDGTDSVASVSVDGTDSVASVSVEYINNISSNEIYDQVSKCINWSIRPRVSLTQSLVINDDNTIVDKCVLSSELLSSKCDFDGGNIKCLPEQCSCSVSQWSPFIEGNVSESHRSAGTSFSSISFSSTSAEDYGIIKCDQDIYEESFEASQSPITVGRDENYNTPPTSPVLALSALDGFHTAPNSLQLDSMPHNDLCSSDEIEDATRNTLDKTMISRTIPIQNDINANEKNGHTCQNVDVVCSYTSALDTFTRDVRDSLREVEQRENNNANAPVFHQTIVTCNTDKHLKLDTPPFISIDTVQYEVDPKSGDIKTVGKGSFGQVYKARFSEPMFYHLPIVVKEFDEEFTNAEEIIEEAQRLFYLHDTGYVPICYGLLCFGTPHAPTYGIVQEYIGTGMTLEQMLWGQYELPKEYWFRIALQCCDGLAKFHDKGILLNDIKTNNIILEFTEHSVRIRFIDFGLATDFRGKRYKNTKSLNDFVYLAPEVRKYGGSTTIASDIYSLGYMLEQIKKYSGVQELMIVARLCMEIDPMTRLSARSAAKLFSDTMTILGYDAHL